MHRVHNIHTSRIVTPEAGLEYSPNVWSIHSHSSLAACYESGPCGDENIFFGSDFPASMIVSMNINATDMFVPGMATS